MTLCSSTKRRCEMGKMKELSAEIAQMDYAMRVEEALRDVINCWEQGDTPLAIDAAINRAADVLERGV
jgi:hypothetical protein